MTDQLRITLVTGRHTVGQGSSILDALAMPPGTEDSEFDPPRMGDGIFKMPDLG